MLSEQMRQALVNAHHGIVSARRHPNKAVDAILYQIQMVLANNPKWTEERLVAGMTVIATHCAGRRLNWEEKERALDSLLKEAGWTREELREMNDARN